MQIVESDSVSRNVCWTPLIFVQDFFVEKKQMLLWSYGHSGKYKFCSFTMKQQETFIHHETRYKENNRIIEKLRVITSWSVLQLTCSWDCAEAAVLLQSSSPKLVKSKSFSNKEMTLHYTSLQPFRGPYIQIRHPCQLRGKRATSTSLMITFFTECTAQGQNHYP